MCIAAHGASLEARRTASVSSPASASKSARKGRMTSRSSRRTAGSTDTRDLEEESGPCLCTLALFAAFLPPGARGPFRDRYVRASSDTPPIPTPPKPANLWLRVSAAGRSRGAVDARRFCRSFCRQSRQERGKEDHVQGVFHGWGFECVQGRLAPLRARSPSWLWCTLCLQLQGSF